MKLYYYKDPKGNFGDDLNVWLWSRLLPNFLDDDKSTLFIGIGTLLNSLLPKDPKKVVFSSGVGYKNPPPPVDNSWKIYCVRGPLSAAKLGIDKDMAITDGAALLNTIDIPEQEKIHRVSFVPHHKSHRPKWELFCKKLGIHYIDPAKSVNNVLADIKRSERVLAESMHGAIVADVFRVPWLPVKFHDHILDFKWQDWCQSLGLNYSPIHLPAFLKPEYPNKYYIRFKYALLTLHLKRVARRGKFFLSPREHLERATTRLLDKLIQLKKDYCLYYHNVE